jgi:hypothetical protein
MEATSQQQRLYNASAAQYMSRRNTKDSIIAIYWHEEPGVSKHEYLLFCVASGVTEEESWMRAERKGKKGTATLDLLVVNPFDIIDGGLTITFAPTKEELYDSGDKEIMSLRWDIQPTAGKPPLRRISGLLLVVDQEHGYTITLFNSWWFARETFLMVVKIFWTDTRTIIKEIKKREHSHLASVVAVPGTGAAIVVGATLTPPLIGFSPVLTPVAVGSVLTYRYGSGIIRFQANRRNIRRRFEALD